MVLYRISEDKGVYEIVEEHVLPGSQRFFWLRNRYNLFQTREDAESVLEESSRLAGEVDSFNSVHGTSLSVGDYLIIKDLLK